MSTRAANALDRMLGSVADCLTTESAERLLRFRVDPQTQARIDELADKANAGRLTDDEQSEYLEYVDAIDVIAILQAQARQVVLRKTGS